MLDETFQTMRDIGAEHGLTSHQLGRILTDQGFRQGGKPTTKAFGHGWVEQRFAPASANYIWAWHVGKTRTLLEFLGHERTVTGQSISEVTR